LALVMEEAVIQAGSRPISWTFHGANHWFSEIPRLILRLDWIGVSVPYMAFNYMLSCSCHAPWSLLFWYNLH
jgi:hypothetical protein